MITKWVIVTPMKMYIGDAKGIFITNDIEKAYDFKTELQAELNAQLILSNPSVQSKYLTVSKAVCYETPLN